MLRPSRPAPMTLPEWFAAGCRIFALAAAAYALVCVAARFVAPGMMFLRPPPSAPLAPETIRIPTDDGVTLHARHWRNPDARHTLLYFSGNGEELSDLAGYLPEYVKRGFSVMAYEYRGYGHTGGTPGEAAAYADAERLLAWLRAQGTPPERVIAFGFSLGGGSAVELARRHRLAGLILEGTFTSAYRVMTRWPVLVGDMFENEKKLPEVRCPVLVLHGSADPVIPDWHARALYAAANEPKRLLIVPGGGHGGLEAVARESYWQAIRDFGASLP